MKTVLTDIALLIGSDKGVLFLTDNSGNPLATVYPDGVVEPRPGYNVEKVAQGIWGPNHQVSSLSFFPGETGLALVTVTSYGKVTYRPGYRPDPLARELWETLGRLCPGVHLGEPVPESCHPSPGFTGMWEINASIDGHRPR